MTLGKEIRIYDIGKRDKVICTAKTLLHQISLLIINQLNIDFEKWPGQ